MQRRIDCRITGDTLPHLLPQSLGWLESAKVLAMQGHDEEKPLPMRESGDNQGESTDWRRRESNPHQRIDVLICGLPLNMDGTFGPRVKLTQKIIALIEVATGKKIIPVDERLSTFEAESRIAGQYTRMQKRRRIDAIAAAQILTDYLAAGNGPARDDIQGDTVA